MIRANTYNSKQRNSKDYLFVLSFIIVFVSKVAWYDLKGIFIVIHNKPLLITLFLKAWAVLLFPFIVLLFLNSKLSRSCPKFVLYFLIVNFYCMLLGIIYRNDLIFLIQDTFKLLLVPAGYLAYRRIWPSFDSNRIFFIIAIAILLFMCIRFILFINLFITNYGLVYGTITDIFAFTFFLARFLYTSNYLHKIAYLCLTIFTCFIIVMGQKRTLLVGVFIILIYFIFNRWRNNILTVLLTITLLLIIITGSFMVRNYPFDIQDNKYTRRLTQTDIKGKIGSESPRMQEVISVYNTLIENGSFSFIYGLGSGAYFEVDYLYKRFGLTKTHSVHFTPAAMIYRGGLLEFALYLFVIGFILIRPKGLIDLDPRILLIIRSYTIAAAITSLVIFCVIDDLLLGFFAGMISMNSKPTKHTGFQKIVVEAITEPLTHPS